MESTYKQYRKLRAKDTKLMYNTLQTILDKDNLSLEDKQVMVVSTMRLTDKYVQTKYGNIIPYQGTSLRDLIYNIVATTTCLVIKYHLDYVDLTYRDMAGYICVPISVLVSLEKDILSTLDYNILYLMPHRTVEEIVQSVPVVRPDTVPIPKHLSPTKIPDPHTDPWTCLCGMCQENILYSSRRGTPRVLPTPYPPMLKDEFNARTNRIRELQKTIVDPLDRLRIHIDIYKTLANNWDQYDITPENKVKIRDLYKDRKDNSTLYGIVAELLYALYQN